MERDGTMLLISDIQLVRSSYRVLASKADELSEEFYRRLFDIEPRLRYLFPEDLTAVRDHLQQMVAFAIRRFDQFEEVRHQLSNLGARHAAYGVKPDDYDLFLRVVNETLTDALGLPEDHETLQAWYAFFSVVAKTMVEGAELQAVSD
jgi:hemoglobin-like flavoprotein